MLSGVECRRGLRCGAGAACVVSVLSNVTENKAFDLPAFAARGSGFLGRQMVREVEGLLLCVFWRRGDIKLRAYCFRGS